MKKFTLSRRKLLRVKILSLGLMALGVVLISWAMFNMVAPFEQFTYATLSKYSEPVPVQSTSALPVPVLIKALYPVYPAEGDNIGSLTIPALERRLPIFHGTGEGELAKGVGHFTQSVLPGEADNSVLSGHRDTVFRNLYNVKIGDRLIVETSAGVFTYEVKSIRIVHANDKTVIVPTSRAVLTLTTCYPFYAIGNAPDRYIVSADLVASRSSRGFLLP